MKVIAENKITSISVDTENANFPIQNVLDEHPKRKFKADGDYQATIECVVSAGTSGVAIFGTNAQGANITITDPNGIDWNSESAWDDENEWAYSEPQAIIEIFQSGDSYSLWGEWNYINAPMELSIVLSTLASQVLNAGVVTVGDILVFKNPKYGLQEGLVDYSIIAEQSNGSTYYKKRDIVRTFAGFLFDNRDENFYTFMLTTARDKGKAPMAWRITDLDSTNWAVYGRFMDMPGGSHDAPIYSNISFNIIEVL